LQSRHFSSGFFGAQSLGGPRLLSIFYLGFEFAFGFLNMNSSQPIGIFDSGIGGLTVAKAVKKLLPGESIIYFGDIAHLPYGDKSTAAIQAYSVRITDYLINRGCKIILIACNSASASSLDLVREFVGKKAKVFDVITPTVDYVRENLEGKRVGLIGTKQTISSKIYDLKINELDRSIDFVSLAAPMLVPMIEEGIYNDHISLEIIKRYLLHPDLSAIDSLILGCTHYPIIKEQISALYLQNQKEVEIIDSAETVAKSLRAYLEYHQLLSKEKNSEDEFKVSDLTVAFEKATKLFFGEQVDLKRIPIWDEYK